MVLVRSGHVRRSAAPHPGYTSACVSEVVSGVAKGGAVLMVFVKVSLSPSRKWTPHFCVGTDLSYSENIESDLLRVKVIIQVNPGGCLNEPVLQTLAGYLSSPEQRSSTFSARGPCNEKHRPQGYMLLSIN